MLQVKKAYIEDFHQIYPLLEHFAIKGMDRERWHALLSERWSQRHKHLGYVLADGMRYVGFLGTFFSDRVIEKRHCCLCNLFCWYVLPEYRHQSLLLLLSLLKEPDITITSLTPSKEASLVLKQFRFRILEEDILIFPLMPLPPTKGSYRIITGKEAACLLNGDNAELSQKIVPTWGNEAVIRQNANSGEDDDSLCHLIFGRVVKKGVPLTQIYHASNPELLMKNIFRLGWHFFRINGTLLTAIDKRLTRGRAAWPYMRKRLRYPRLFRTEDLAPHEIDNLFTELLFLKTI